MDVTLGTCRMMTQISWGMGSPQWQNLGSFVGKYLPRLQSLVVHPRRSLYKDFGVTEHWHSIFGSKHLPTADETGSTPRHYKYVCRCRNRGSVVRIAHVRFVTSDESSHFGCQRKHRVGVLSRYSYVDSRHGALWWSLYYR